MLSYGIEMFEGNYLFINNRCKFNICIYLDFVNF